MLIRLSRNVYRSFYRYVPANRTLTSKALTFSSFGEPEDVLSISERPVGDIGDDELIVKMCASPINPSDINMIQGKYGIKPNLPSLAGNEGAGKVIAYGSKVGDFAIGDLVIPIVTASGTWQTHLRAKANNFYRFKHPVQATHAAIFRINPSTAYRLIQDFVAPKSGDVIIQNGATSAVGIYVIQLAKLFGLKTINLFRPRSTADSTEATRQLLKDFGATWAFTEDEFTDSSNAVANEAKSSGPIQLALNCLGGKPTLVLLKVLGKHGTLVSYGAMTRNPMTIPVGPLIFQDIRIRGFWLTEWSKQASKSQFEEMLNNLSLWFSDGSLMASPYLEVPFTQWKHAIELAKFDDAGPTGIRNKIILNMENET